MRWPNPVRALLLLTLGSISNTSTGAPCGSVHRLATHAGTSSVYAFAAPAQANAPPLTTLVLLPGGGGHLDLDERSGCARAMKGNSLVRSQPLFVAAGFATALLDAPSDHHGEDGLAGFRSAPAHAQDLALLIAELRQRIGGPVWLVGTSRGTISAANAAARLGQAAGPDGLVLSSALMAGQPGARKPWVEQSVFDLPLQAIRQPLLLIAHEGDRCPRSPPALMPRLAERAVAAARLQQVLLRGGPGQGGAGGADVCEGRAPHGYVGQEAELVEAIGQFVRGAAR